MHSAATQSALHFHVTQILIENPRQHLTTQPVGGRYKTQVTGHRAQGTGHRSQVTGHCFTYKESILNIHKANLRPKNFSLGLIRPKISFYECLGYFSLGLIRPKKT